MTSKSFPALETVITAHFSQGWSADMTVVLKDYHRAEKFLSPSDIIAVVM